MDKKSIQLRNLGLALVQSARDWRKLAAQALVGDGVSESCAVALLWAARLGGGVRQVVLAEKLGIESASLVRILDQLCAAGLVVRQPDPTDRRANSVWVTQQGAVVAEKLEVKLVALRAKVFGELPSADIEGAMRVCEAIRAAAGRVSSPQTEADEAPATVRREQSSPQES